MPDPKKADLQVRLPHDHFSGRRVDSSKKHPTAVAGGYAGRVQSGRFYFSPVEDCKPGSFGWHWDDPKQLFCATSKAEEALTDEELEEVLQSGSYGRVVCVESIYVLVFHDGRCIGLDDQTGEEVPFERPQKERSFEEFIEAASWKLRDEVAVPFLEEVAPTFEDPPFDPENHDEEILFSCGSEEEFKRMVRAAVQAEPQYFLGLEVSASIAFATTNEKTGTGYFASTDTEYANDHEGVFESMSLPDETQNLLNRIYDENTPTGLSYTYNDGAHRRRSGYSAHAKIYSVSVATPTDQAVHQARETVREWLAEHHPESPLIKRYDRPH